MKKMVFILLIWFAAGFAVVVASAYLFQAKIVYAPERQIYRTPTDIGLDYENIILETQDHLFLSAWFIPSKYSRGVILFCHGNAGNISHRLDSIRIFHELNLDVLIFDYRGYGESEGRPSETGTYLDAQSAWNYLVNRRNITPSRIIIFGRSLGAAVAAELALYNEAKAFIVESGFTSVPDIGKHYFPFLPVTFISRFDYSTIDKVRNIKIPKLFIHSTDDEIIPFRHGQLLYETAAVPKEMLAIRGNHNERFLISQKNYTEGFENFMSKYLR